MLERRLLQLLGEQGPQPYYTLLSALGEEQHRLPPYLAEAPGEAPVSTLERLLRHRPHLFRVVLGDTIQPAPGGGGRVG